MGSGLRVHWKAPYQMAQDTFSNLVQVAKGMTSSSGATIGFGLASKPLDGMTQDAVWRAMLTAMRDPVGAGMKVDSVRVQDMSGYMQRSCGVRGAPSLGPGWRHEGRTTAAWRTASTTR